MATITRTAGTLTQVTATGNTGEIAIGTRLGVTCSIVHSNGTGTITAGAEIQPQVKHGSSGTWRDYGGPISFGTTAEEVETRTFDLEGGRLPLTAIRFAYTAPTGSTGHTLDVDFTTADSIG